MGLNKFKWKYAISNVKTHKIHFAYNKTKKLLQWLIKLAQLFFLFFVYSFLSLEHRSFSFLFSFPFQPTTLTFNLSVDWFIFSVNFLHSSYRANSTLKKLSMLLQWVLKLAKLVFLVFVYSSTFGALELFLFPFPFQPTTLTFNLTDSSFQSTSCVHHTGLIQLSESSRCCCNEC